MIAGIGINDATYKPYKVVDGKTIVCPYYQTWVAMISRCYRGEIPTYRDCTVCDDWLLFSNFRRWMIEQAWEGKHLDKDIRVIGNRVYSPDTCLFVSPQINWLLIDSPSRRGNMPVGVHKDRGKFRAMIRLHGKTVHLGRFNSKLSASKAYKAAKRNHIAVVASLETEPIKSAVLRHADCYA